MKTRTVLMSFVAVAIICVAGPGVCAASSSEHEAPAATGSQPSTASSQSGRQRVESASSQPAARSTSHRSRNQSSPQLWSRPKQTASKAAPRDARELLANVHVPLSLGLDLNLSTDAAGDVDPATPDQAPPAVANRAQNAASIDPLTLGLNSSKAGHHTSAAEDAHLFNRDNGLRGFMAHNWLTGNVGLQGGLAIKENRMRQEDSNLGDNVAVGMGVLLAF